MDALLPREERGSGLYRLEKFEEITREASNLGSFS